MWIRLIPYVIVVALVAGGMWKWDSMVDTIERQKQEIAIKAEKINSLEDNIIVIKEQAKDAQKQAVEEAVIKERKRAIEIGMKKDESNKVDIGSTRFYVTP